MQRILTPQERFIDLLNYLGLNAHSFAHKLGLSNPQSIYSYTYGKNKKVSLKMAERVSAVFPFISKLWLLTGEGSMLENGDYRITNQNGNVTTNNIQNSYGTNLNGNFAGDVHADNASEDVLEDDGVPVIPDGLCGIVNFDVAKFRKNMKRMARIPFLGDYDYYYRVSDSDMYPYFIKGDLLAIQTMDLSGDNVEEVLPIYIPCVVNMKSGTYLRLVRFEDGGFSITDYAGREVKHVSPSEIIHMFSIVSTIRTIIIPKTDEI